MTNSEELNQDRRAGGAETGEIAATKPPWPTQTPVISSLLVAVVVIVTAWVGCEYAGGWDCRHWPFFGQVEVRSIDGQCIGYSDGFHFQFNDEPGQGRLLEAQKLVFRQNETAHDRWENKPDRPYVTVVYLAALSGREARENEEAYATERQELEGLAIAQYAGLQEPASSPDVPLLNIVIANAGRQMEHAEEVVGMIAELKDPDAPLVGVIGLSESRTKTEIALKKLQEKQIPLISPAANADDFERNSKFYRQLSAPNKEQARMISEYSKQVLKAKTARIYWTVGRNSSFDDDLYVNTLVKDLVKTLSNDRITTENEGEFTGQIDRNVCGNPRRSDQSSGPD